MQIILRGKKVKTVAIAKSLSKTEVDYYRPQVLANNSSSAPSKPAVKIVFGFSQNKNHYGIMMYHRNRLIKPYVRVGYQLKVGMSNLLYFSLSSVLYNLLHSCTECVGRGVQWVRTHPSTGQKDPLE